MGRLIFAVITLYTIILVVSLILICLYFQKMLRMKKELQKETSESSKYLRCKIMIWTSIFLIAIFGILLFLVIFINIK